VNLWEQICLSEPEDERVWELYHENSKTHRFSSGPADAEAVAVMLRLSEDLEYAGMEAVDLPELDLPPAPLREAILGRRTPLSFADRPLALGDLSCLLQAGYGTVPRPSVVGQRVFRTVPSGGALYPLEIYVYARSVADLDEGLYHFRATRPAVQRLETPTTVDLIAPMFVQPDLIRTAGAVIFVTAVFERSTFKYGERGYRFALLEAGHVAQNISLTATVLGGAAVPLGGFFDREVEELLAIDGVEHSMLYAVAVGSI